MAKRRKKKGFEEKHPFIFLATLPVSLPLAVAADMKKNSKKTTKKRKVFIPKDIRDMDGYQFEEYVARQLARAGYTNVDVTPKSGDYGADILARCNGKKVCVQCKKYKNTVGIEAVQQVIGAMAYYKCEIGIVISTVGYTEAAKKLAAAGKVVLMGADRIRKV